MSSALDPGASEPVPGVAGAAAAPRVVAVIRLPSAVTPAARRERVLRMGDLVGGGVVGDPVSRCHVPT